MLSILARPALGAVAIAALVSVGVAQPAAAKTPGHEYCFHGTCHRVHSLEETRRLVGTTTTLKASFYDDPKNDRYNPSNITSSGEYFRADRADNAASPLYPDGTKLLVWHPASRKALVIRINNAGPYWGDRTLDLSRAAADTFGFRGAGVARVQVRVIHAPSKAEATYKRGRSYPATEGYIGRFASLDAALVTPAAAATRLASAGPVPGTPSVPGGRPSASAVSPNAASGLLDARNLTPSRSVGRQVRTAAAIPFR